MKMGGNVFLFSVAFAPVCYCELVIAPEKTINFAVFLLIMLVNAII